MTFDELAVNHAGVARRQARSHAQALLDRAHVRFDMVVDGKAVVAQVANPLLAATTVGVAEDINGLPRLGQGAQGQQAESDDFFAQHVILHC
ncbi:hypothetical protein D3C73_1460990 [compost metagenome]